MIEKLDHLIVAVSDIDEAENNYSKVFGTGPVWRGEHAEYGTENSLFNFNNIYFELLAAKGDGLGAMLVNHALQETGEGLIGIVFGTDNLKETHQTLSGKGFLLGDISNGEGANFKNNKIRKWKNLFLPPELTRGIFSFLIEHTEGTLPIVDKFEPSIVNKLDHVVINTNDPDGFIDVYQDTYGIRLALDQTVEKWGGRMLFFRLNKTTIEVIAKKDEKKVEDKLWGLAWEVKSIEDAHKRLSDEGVDISPIKEGIKENTLVATIKSHTHNVPTLLIEHI